jgi:hypothetical protein
MPGSRGASMRFWQRLVRRSRSLDEPLAPDHAALVGRLGRAYGGQRMAVVGTRRSIRAASAPLEQVGDPPGWPMGDLGCERLAREAIYANAWNGLAPERELGRQLVSTGESEAKRVYWRPPTRARRRCGEWGESWPPGRLARQETRSPDRAQFPRWP